MVRKNESKHAIHGNARRGRTTSRTRHRLSFPSTSIHRWYGQASLRLYRSLRPEMLAAHSILTKQTRFVNLFRSLSLSPLQGFILQFRHPELRRRNPSIRHIRDVLLNRLGRVLLNDRRDRGTSLFASALRHTSLS